MHYNAVQCGTAQCSIEQHSMVQWLSSAGPQQVLVRDRRWRSPLQSLCQEDEATASTVVAARDKQSSLDYLQVRV